MELQKVRDLLTEQRQPCGLRGLTRTRRGNWEVDGGECARARIEALGRAQVPDRPHAVRVSADGTTSNNGTG